MGNLASMRPWYLGLAFCHIWIYCTTHRFTFGSTISVMAVMYAALSAFLIALFLVVRHISRRGRDAATGALASEALAFPSGRLADVLDALGALCMTVCAVLLAAPPEAVASDARASAVAVAVASTLGGMGIAWAYMRWGQFYAKLDIHLAAPLIFATMAIGSVVKAVVDLLPPVAAAVALAVVSWADFWFMRRSIAEAPEAPEAPRYYTSRTVASLVRLALGIAVYSLTVGVIQSMFLESAAIPAASVVVHHGSEVLLGAVMVAWVTVLQRRLDFSRTWRLILVLMGTALIFESHFSDEAMTYLLSLIRTAQTFLIVFLFLALADVARHSPYHPMAVFSLGWTAYTLPFMLGKVAGDALVSNGPDTAFVASVIVWVLLVVMLFVLDEEAAGNRLIFTELNEPGGRGEGDTPGERMDAVQRELNEASADAAQGRTDVLALRCAKLAEEGGLTPREREILEMLVRGRSKSHIADAFLISENTVRGHVKHIYAKLDVHGKQELVDRVEAVEL